MTIQRPDPTATDPRPRRSTDPASSGPGGHRLMMLVCCVPMIAAAVLLIATGVAGVILIAFGCVAMMAAMMFLMPGDHRHP